MESRTPEIELIELMELIDGVHEEHPSGCQTIARRSNAQCVSCACVSANCSSELLQPTTPANCSSQLSAVCVCVHIGDVCVCTNLLCAMRRRTMRCSCSKLWKVKNKQVLLNSVIEMFGELLVVVR